MEADEHMRTIMKEDSRFCRLLNPIERIEVIIEKFSGRQEKVFQEGCEMLKKELEQLKRKREMIEILEDESVDADLEVRCRLILSGLKGEEMLDLLTQFLEENAEEYVLHKKLVESNNNAPMS